MHLRGKILLWVLLVATVISLGFGYLNFRLQSTRLRQDMADRAKAATHRLRDALPQALYEFAMNQVQKSLEAEMSDRDISGVLVLDKNKKVVAGKTRDEAGNVVDLKEAPETAPGATESLIYNGGGSQEDLGSVSIYLDDRYVKQAINKTLVYQIVQAVALDVTFIFLILLLVQRLVTEPLTRISDGLTRIAQGDFSENVSGSLLTKTDEIGAMARSLSALNENLHQQVLPAFKKLAEGNFTFQASGLISEPLEKTNSRLNRTMMMIREVAQRVAAGSCQISDTGNSLLHGATEQLSSLNDVTKSVGSISSQTRTNAENASQANLLARTASQAAQSGSAKIQDMVSAMNEISTSSREITKILKTIDDIAFQTNLLALNAAVEAARAGRHGKGFAVVAEEVRNLATRTTTAAHETAGMIETSNAKVENGMQVALEASETFNQIASHSVKVTDLVGEIAASSREQAEGISQIEQGLGRIDTVTQQNSTCARDTASASNELSQQAKQLQKLLEQFTLRR